MPSTSPMPPQNLVAVGISDRSTEPQTQTGYLPSMGSGSLTTGEHGLLSGNPKITPHALRRTYISLMLEAGAPLPYVMDQVGHGDSKTTLEIYAQVRKRVSRKNVHAAFDRLPTGADSDGASAGV